MKRSGDEAASAQAKKARTDPAAPSEVPAVVADAATFDAAVRAITVNPRRPLSHEGAELRSEPSLSLEQGLDLLERSMSFDENGYPSSECPLFALLSTWPPVEPPGLVLLGQLLSDPSLAKKIPIALRSRWKTVCVNLGHLLVKLPIPRSAAWLPTVDIENFEPEDWPLLVAISSLLECDKGEELEFAALGLLNAAFKQAQDRPISTNLTHCESLLNLWIFVTDRYPSASWGPFTLFCRNITTKLIFSPAVQPALRRALWQRFEPFSFGENLEFLPKGGSDLLLSGLIPLISLLNAERVRNIDLDEGPSSEALSSSVLATEDPVLATSFFLLRMGRDELQLLLELLFAPSLVRWDGTGLFCLAALGRYFEFLVPHAHTSSALVNDGIGTTFAARLQEETSLRDVTFKFPNSSSTLKAHRLVLSLNSDYFKTLFSSQFADAKTAELTINEVDPEEFKLMLDFFYGRDVRLARYETEQSRDLLMGLLRLGQRFLAPDLVANCIPLLLRFLSSSFFPLELWESIWSLQDLELRKKFLRRLVPILLQPLSLCACEEDVFRPIFDNPRCCRDIQDVLLAETK